MTARRAHVAVGAETPVLLAVHRAVVNRPHGQRAVGDPVPRLAGPRSSGACGWAPLYWPNATPRERYDAYMAQYDVAPSTVAFLKDNMKPALHTFGDERIGELPEPKRARSTRSTPGTRSTRSMPSRVRPEEAFGGEWRDVDFEARDINNWRNCFWTPSLQAAGVKHRRIYDLRHTYATWSSRTPMSA